MTPEQQQLVINNLKLVKRLASKVGEKLPRFVDREELVATGILGLVKAALRYSPDNPQGASFTTYATYVVRGAILDSLSQLGSTEAQHRNKINGIEKVKHHLYHALHRDPTDEEIAAAMKLTDQEYLALIRKPVREVLSLEHHSTDDEACWDQPMSPDISPEQDLISRQQAVLVRQAIDTLPAKWRAMMEMYYFCDMRYKDIAPLLELHVTRISQIRTESQKKIREYLLKHGVRRVA